MRASYSAVNPSGVARCGAMQGCSAATISRGNSVRATRTPQKVPLPSAGAGAREPRDSSCYSCYAGGAETTEECLSMCDYSLQNVKSRPAKVGEKLRTQHFNTGTIGFAAPEDTKTAVCVLPGTELAFATRYVSDASAGQRVSSITRRPSFGKSTRTSREGIMMRWNFLMDRRCY
jgi:hypothetical protein